MFESTKFWSWSNISSKFKRFLTSPTKYVDKYIDWSELKQQTINPSNPLIYILLVLDLTFQVLKVCLYVWDRILEALFSFYTLTFFFCLKKLEILYSTKCKKWQELSDKKEDINSSITLSKWNKRLYKLKNSNLERNKYIQRRNNLRVKENIQRKVLIIEYLLDEQDTGPFPPNPIWWKFLPFLPHVKRGKQLRLSNIDDEDVRKRKLESKLQNYHKLSRSLIEEADNPLIALNKFSREISTPNNPNPEHLDSE